MLALREPRAKRDLYGLQKRPIPVRTKAQNLSQTLQFCSSLSHGHGTPELSSQPSFVTGLGFSWHLGELWAGLWAGWCFAAWGSRSSLLGSPVCAGLWPSLPAGEMAYLRRGIRLPSIMDPPETGAGHAGDAEQCWCGKSARASGTQRVLPLQQGGQWDPVRNRDWRSGFEPSDDPRSAQLPAQRRCCLLFAPVNWLCGGAGLHFLPHLLQSHWGLSVLVLVDIILHLGSISRGLKWCGFCVFLT